MKIKALLGTLVLVSAGAANTAMAVEKGDWLVRFGASNVDPKSDNHPIVSVDDGSSFTANVAYMFTDNLSVELLAAYPFEHDIDAKGSISSLGKVGSTKHLPPTVTLQYYFNNTTQFTPFLGAGLNYTHFFDEDTKGALSGTDLDLDDSWGYALEGGVDYNINDHWMVSGQIYYINIETRAKIDAVPGSYDVDINPWVYFLSAGYKF